MSKIENLFKTDTLRGRLRIFILNLILFVVLVISAFLIYMTKKQVQISFNSQLNSVVKMQSQSIDKWLNEREIDISILANNNIVKSKDIKSIKALFESFVNHQSEFFYVAFVNKEGYSLVDSTFETGRYFGDKTYFLDTLGGFDTISKVQEAETPILHFSSAVYDNKDNLIGVVVAGVRLSSIQRLVEDFRFGTSGETFILNSEGKLLTNRRFDKEDLIFTKVDFKGDGEIFYENYQNTPVLGTLKKTNFDRWTIVAQISQEEIYEIFREFLFAVSIFVIALVVLLIPLILNFSNRLEKPLQFLLQGSKRIENGEYGHKIDSNHIKHATMEIKDLTHSFNSMSSVLHNVINELTKKSTIDMLTGLYNRRELLNLSLDKFNISKDKEREFAILMIDIDFFKKVNDTYGHPAGDTVIASVANSIKTSISNADVAGRYGGEEFLVCIDSIERTRVLEVSERIRANVEGLLIRHENLVIRCTCSIGGYFIKLDKDNLISLDSCIDLADQKLYEAKEGGRNRVVI